MGRSKMSRTPATTEVGATELYIIPSKHADPAAASELDDEKPSISFSTLIHPVSRYN
jgi:hypothetical protein